MYGFSMEEAKYIAHKTSVYNFCSSSESVDISK